MDSTQLAQPWDVVVVGAGTAGVPAAVQAARAGARTLLVERTGSLGGTITVGGVALPGLFHAWGRQVIAGIGWELVARTVAECGGTLPDFARPVRHHSLHQVRLDPAIYAALCAEELVAAGVAPLLHAMPARAEATAGGWRLELCTRRGLVATTAAVLIDCSGDADLAALAGAQLVQPAETQPTTMMYRVGGVDPERLDAVAVEAAARRAVDEGRLRATDFGYDPRRVDPIGWLRRAGDNSNHQHGIQAVGSAGHTRAELEGRAALLRAWRFMRAQPGAEGLRLLWAAGECGVRETATIVGEGAVTVADYLAGRCWPDGLCHAFYPIDLHTAHADGLDLRPLTEGVVPSVPRAALLPRGTARLLVAGRCLASDRLANSALRVQATCMATGQAAGALAALSARAGCDPRAVPIAEARALLAAHGAILPPLG